MTKANQNITEEKDIQIYDGVFIVDDKERK